jgi:uncharacterized protein (DUF2141 family)
MLLLPLLLAAEAVKIPSSPELGKAEGRCRPNESGPALLADIVGLKDRKGLVKIEVYPPKDEDFFQDDNILISQGKTFRRWEEPVPATGPVRLCVRVPAPGAYAVMVLHDRDANHKLGLSVDGVGVSVDPHFRFTKPKVAAARVVAGNGPTHVTITMAYRSSLISFDPIKP